MIKIKIVNNNFFNLILLLLVSAGLSCQGEEEVSTPNDKPAIEVPQAFETLEFSNEDNVEGVQSIDVTFSATLAWQITTQTRSVPDWINVYPTSGEAGEAKITVTLNHNTSTENRSAEIIISTAQGSATIEVIQKGAEPEPELEPDEEISGNGEDASSSNW